MKRNKVEILSPAGDPEKLRTVVDYGADAVYMSGKKFGLRSFSGNFTNDEMVQSIAYAHEHGVKCYVTMNIMAHEPDLESVDEYIAFLYDEAKADAVLVSDPGLFRRVKKVRPQLEIHISTQASVTNSEGCNFWYEQGARRIVPAREVSLKEIAAIRENIPEDLSLECFIHGAMCVSYSGRCLLSNLYTGRNSNNGACAQPCRWGYEVKINEEKRPDIQLPMEEDERGTYILSSNDICMIDHIPEMIEAGIDSFKIEGRIKGAYYAAAATKVYKEAVELYYSDPENYKVNPRWHDILENVVHRDYATGFFFDRPIENAQIGDRRTYNKSAFVVGVVIDADEERGLYKVSQRNKMYAGDRIDALMPKGYVDTFAADELYDENFQPIDSTPHPQMTFYMKLHSDTKLQKGSFLIRQGDKDNGINPDN